MERSSAAFATGDMSSIATARALQADALMVTAISPVMNERADTTGDILAHFHYLDDAMFDVRNSSIRYSYLGTSIIFTCWKKLQTSSSNFPSTHIRISNYEYSNL